MEQEDVGRNTVNHFPAGVTENTGDSYASRNPSCPGCETPTDTPPLEDFLNTANLQKEPS